MITERELEKNFGGGKEYLFDVVYNFVMPNGWGMRVRELAYLIYPSAEENINNPRLYMRFTEYRNQFQLISLTKVTIDNLHEYQEYTIRGMKCEIRG